MRVHEVVEAIDAAQLERAAKAKQSGGLKLKKFYSSFQWRRVRYEFLRSQPRPLRCCVCNRTGADGVRLCVDHIRSMRRYPELKTSLSNLQVMCSECNFGKGSDWTDDWRADIEAA